MATVLVTGGSGFIAVHCIVQLLQAGHRVRTTLRSLSREAEVRAMVREGGVEAGERLSFLAADLGADAAWPDAVADCDFVLHPASPTPAIQARTDDDFILPARDGVLRVLRAARDAGVRRVVLTSAFGAVVWSPEPKQGPYLETDWSRTDSTVPLYQRSKTLSERAAWEFIAREGGALELSAVNPVAVLGPALGPDTSHSLGIVRQLLTGMPGCPKIYSPYVDVRDVAALHLLAMEHPAAKGERFIAAAPGTHSMADVGRVLRRRLGPAGSHVPTRELPNWLVRLVALRNPAVKMVVPHLGAVRETSSAKAQKLLGWSARPFEEAVVAAAESLLRLGVAKAA
ncbi:MAG: aldehyde reductase [Myxococcales bacterium]